MARQAVIAGAGIGGLSAALALARHGWQVMLLERASVLAEAGAGLQISPNASAILREWGLLGALEANAVAPAGIRIRSAASAATLSYLPLTSAAARWGSPYLVAHRADLQRVLAEAVSADPAITLYTGTALAGFATDGDGVTVTARQGALTRSFHGDLLIGADGIRSQVRARLVAGASDAPEETGRTAWRTIVPASAASLLLRLHAESASETGLWLGRDVHLVHYPLRGGESINVVAVIADAPLDPGPGAFWSSPGEARVIEARFAHWHSAARTLIAAAPSWTRWPVFDRAPLAQWNAGPVALLGDAAHPVLPFLAQGAAQAIEDAFALAQALEGTGPVAAGLATYSRLRQPRAARVQAAARRLGQIYHLAGPAASARNLVMRAMGAGRLLAGYDWLYGHFAPFPVKR